MRLKTFSGKSPGLTKKIGESPPVLLFHYMSPRGLVGIVKSKSVWASRHEFLNDNKEGRIPFIIASKLLDKWSRNTRKKDSAKEYARNTLRNLDESGEPRFIFSLTEDGDLLSQWRGYCPGSGGYSIGFDSRMIKDVARDSDFDLVKCVYSRGVLEDYIAHLLNYGEQMYVSASNRESPGPSYDRMFRFINGCLDEISCIAKDPSFKEENEWRLISKPIEKIKYRGIKHRGGEGYVIPYCDVEMPLDSCGLDKKYDPVVVRAGPSRKQKMAINGARSVCRMNDLEVKIVMSHSPFR